MVYGALKIHPYGALKIVNLISSTPEKFFTYGMFYSRDNLLRLKIYYEELSSVNVQEIQTYGLSSLESK